LEKKIYILFFATKEGDLPGPQATHKGGEKKKREKIKRPPQEHFSVPFAPSLKKKRKEVCGCLMKNRGHNRLGMKGEC